MTSHRLRVPLRFLVVGVLNTLVGLLAIYMGKWWLGLGDVLANLFGYAIGLCFSFVVNRSWTFDHSGAVVPALMRFLVVFGIAYALNLATVLAAIRVFGINAYIAQALGIVPYTLFFFLGSRYYAFRAGPAR